MNTNDTADNQTLKLVLLEGIESQALANVATLIRGLPQVVRVRLNAPDGQLEILHRRGNRSLLHDIHSILMLVHGMPASIYRT